MGGGWVDGWIGISIPDDLLKRRFKRNKALGLSQIIDL